MSGYELRLLGPPGLWRAGAPVAVRSRKTWFLLAYLAIEGPTEREPLAELLWASPSGRANLRAELYRLERAAPGLVIREGGRLALAGVEVDALRFFALAEEDPKAALAIGRGVFLEGLEAGLTPELEEWLGHQRARHRERWAGLLLAHAGRVADPRAATRLLETLLSEDPLNEEAVRLLMRRHAEAGAGTEALRVYRRFSRFLEAELGLPPEPETRALARAIQEGRAWPLKAPGSRFAGRARELRAMHQAFEAGCSVFLSGEPGIGKSRLLAEFVAALGRRRLVLRGRPGDPAVPYATLARGVRELLAIGARPPDWAARELARVVPELGEPPAAAHPARFVAAFAELLRPYLGGEWVLGVDDLQYLDSASANLLLQLTGDRLPGPFLAAYRRGTLPDAIAAWVQEERAAGRAVEVELAPLDAEAAAEMLGLEPSRAAALNRLAGGNPFFLLQLAREPDPSGSRSVIQGRLAAASTCARELAALAAVAGEAYRLERAIALLGAPPLVVAEASDELERLGLFRRGRVAHDLVAEAILEGLSPEVRAHWHRRLAETLEDEAPAAALAEHWLAAGEPAVAARYWQRAAFEAERAFAYREALALFARALAHTPEDEQDAREMETFIPRYRIHLALADWKGARELLARAGAFARARGLTWLVDRVELGHADLDFRQGRFQEALARATRLLEAGHLDPDAQAHAHYLRAVALQALGRHRETAEACRRALAAGGEGWEMNAWALNTLAIAEMHLGRLAEARRLNGEALRRFREEKNPVGEANALRVLAELAGREGRDDEAERLFEEALALARRTGHQIVLSFVLAAALRHHRARGREDRVRALAEEGAAIPGPYQAFFRAHR